MQKPLQRETPGTLELISNSVEETWRIGAKLGELALPGDVFLLEGGLGSGKTTLTQGIARGVGAREDVTSPTFVLVHEYRTGRLPIYHIDLYRLDRLDEMWDLGLDDYLFGKGLCVVEWAEKGKAIFPYEHILIRLRMQGETRRHLRLEASGGRYAELLDEL